MTNQIRVLGSVLLVGLLLAACDKTADEYHQQKVEQQLALYQQISGVYRGTIQTQGVTLGDIEVQLDSAVGQTTLPDGTQSAGQAALEVHVTIFNAKTSNVQMQNGYCFAQSNSGDCQFSASTTVALGGGVTGKLTIAGTVSGDQVSGLIKVDDTSGVTGDFKAVKNASFPSAQGSTAGHLASGANSISKFVGSYQDQNCLEGALDKADPASKSVCTVDVVLTSESVADDDAQSFYNNFSDVHMMSVQLSQSETVLMPDGDSTVVSSQPVALQAVQWNSRNGTLHGQQSNVGTNQATVSLDCEQVQVSSTAQGWQCTYTNNSYGKSISFLATPAPLNKGK